MREAKRVHQLILQKADTGNLDSDSDSDSEDQESDDEQIETPNNNQSNISAPTNDSNSSSSHVMKTAHLNSSKVALFTKRKVEAVKATKRIKRKENDSEENGDMMGKVMTMMFCQRQADKEEMKAEMMLRKEERMEEAKLRRLEFKQQQQQQQQQSMMMNMMFMSMMQGRQSAMPFNMPMMMMPDISNVTKAETVDTSSDSENEKFKARESI